jgi:predicted aspartyl protease
VNRAARRGLSLLSFAACLATGSGASGGPSGIVIPIEIENGNPVAQVRINGVAAKLIIDSGGESLLLKSPAIDRVGATRTGSSASGTDALGNTRDQALLTLRTLDIAGRTFQDVAAQEAGVYAADSAGDGVIGRRFLNEFVAVYDYAGRTVSLFESRAAAGRQCRGTRVRMRPDAEDLVVTRAVADGHQMRVLWDTGAVQSFVKKSFADDRRLTVEMPFYSARKFTLAGHDTGPLRFVVLDLQAPASVDAFLGYNFFADRVVCIDPRGGSVNYRAKR